MVLDKIVGMWTNVEEQYKQKFAGKVSREDYFKKLVIYKNGKHNIPLIKAKLKPEVHAYNEEQLAVYSGLIQVLESVEFVLNTYEFPENIPNIDDFIQQCVEMKLSSTNRVEKVMSDDIFLELTPTKISREETTKYSPLEIFSKYGVFGSIFTAKESMVLDRNDFSQICIIENQGHLEEFLELPMTDTLARLIKHIRALADMNNLQFNVPYLMPSTWKKEGNNFVLLPTYKGKTLSIPEKQMKYVDTQYSKFYEGKLRVGSYTHLLHLLV